jgi:hypothetical protein
MHDSLFVLCNLLLCADLRPEPPIITTRYTRFGTGGIDHCNNLSIITLVMIFIVLLTCDLLEILMMHEFHKFSLLHVNFKFSLTIRIYPPSHFQLFVSVNIFC